MEFARFLSAIYCGQVDQTAILSNSFSQQFNSVPQIFIGIIFFDLDTTTLRNTFNFTVKNVDQNQVSIQLNKYGLTCIFGIKIQYFATVDQDVQIQNYILTFNQLTDIQTQNNKQYQFTIPQKLAYQRGVQCAITGFDSIYQISPSSDTSYSHRNLSTTTQVDSSNNFYQIQIQAPDLSVNLKIIYINCIEYYVGQAGDYSMIHNVQQEQTTQQITTNQNFQINLDSSFTGNTIASFLGLQQFDLSQYKALRLEYKNFNFQSNQLSFQTANLVIIKQIQTIQNNVFQGVKMVNMQLTFKLLKCVLLAIQFVKLAQVQTYVLLANQINLQILLLSPVATAIQAAQLVKILLHNAQVVLKVCFFTIKSVIQFNHKALIAIKIKYVKIVKNHTNAIFVIIHYKFALVVLIKIYIFQMEFVLINSHQTHTAIYKRYAKNVQTHVMDAIQIQIVHSAQIYKITFILESVFSNNHKIPIVVQILVFKNFAKTVILLVVNVLENNQISVRLASRDINQLVLLVFVNKDMVIVLFLNNVKLAKLVDVFNVVRVQINAICVKCNFNQTKQQVNATALTLNSIIQLNYNNAFKIIFISVKSHPNFKILVNNVKMDITIIINFFVAIAENRNIQTPKINVIMIANLSVQYAQINQHAFSFKMKQILILMEICQLIQTKIFAIIVVVCAMEVSNLIAQLAAHKQEFMISNSKHVIVKVVDLIKGMLNVRQLLTFNKTIFGYYKLSLQHFQSPNLPQCFPVNLGKQI
ncbi:H-type lectin domain protein (macronuclear) [Tetrahymena thermophila SB210]|uniref:H-type lectin domain protein n=1 Tax=Tetrahymena thermophila (strain SB210) TaxID=312017 RepID=Q22P10_TETTS|nr:H-type lectin domain protein [Tetrahymena thermophila SB210]EAR87001.3 H-type lectin domain protein [Tetrahymena thermophila SB210]|eukprot:XP_001007246.3 H-type lectin domain protein [Tetrahymena thermophila SB210]